MPITGFNELVEELKLMREQFKEQQERQVAEQRKRQQLETVSYTHLQLLSFSLFDYLSLLLLLKLLPHQFQLLN